MARNRPLRPTTALIPDLNGANQSTKEFEYVERLRGEFMNSNATDEKMRPAFTVIEPGNSFLILCGDASDVDSSGLTVVVVVFFQPDFFCRKKGGINKRLIDSHIFSVLVDGVAVWGT